MAIENNMPNPPIKVKGNYVRYMSDKRYFEELKRKDFALWFSKYYAALKPAKIGPVLDVGCGVGQVVNQLAEEGFYAVGVDVSPIGMKIACGDGKGSFIVASAVNLPFKDHSFESVGSYDFLEHTHCPDTCLNEMVRVLKPNGKFVIISPNFLKVIGLKSDYHWHMRGFKQKMLNVYILLKKIIYSLICPWKMSFDFMQPKLGYDGGDADAVCVTNPIDTAFYLRKLGVKIVYQSALSTFQPNKILEIVSELPIVRSITGVFFIIGTKSRSDRVGRRP
jgi:SAM-dependent methyltransferase